MNNNEQTRPLFRGELALAITAALTMGKVIGIMGAWLDKHFVFDIYHRKTKV